MTPEEIAQIHKALQESNDILDRFAKAIKEMAGSEMPHTVLLASRTIIENKAAMEILSKEYKSPDKLKIPLDVEL